MRNNASTPAASSPAPSDEAGVILAGLNPVQQTAVTATDGPVLIIAGPGSGKTRTVAHRIAYLLAVGKAAPWQILALTFTNKASREMRERIQKLVGETAAKGMWMGTFHSVFSRVLRREAGHIGYSSDFSIYDTDDSERILRELMNRFNVDPKQFTVRSMQSCISSAKNSLVPPAQYAKLAASPPQEKAALLYGPYQEALRKSNAMDFDDLLIKPIELFDRHPEVLAAYQERWRYLHIDEYQDTNHAQYMLARQLSGRHQNLCVVGDDAQSIYAFRGADIGNILSFQRDFPNATVVRLEQNYRSTGHILRMADSIIRHNQDQLEKTLWTDNREGDPILLMEALSEKDEAQKIERAIRDLQVRLGHPYRDFAVLYRTNAQSRSLEEAFRRAGVPYKVVGGVSFYQRREIKDVLAYLRLVVNPHDTASLRRVINYPTRGIGDKTLEDLTAFAVREGLTLWQALETVETLGLPPRAAASIIRFRTMIERYAALAASGTASADAVARDLIEETGVMKGFREENTQESLMRWENVQELISAIAEYAQAAAEATLSTFLQEVSLLTDADNETADDNKVTLMTLHASKGLEFPVVFVTGLEEGLFPLSNASQDRKDLEEERRLLYVGVTRAQDRVYISYARSRFRYGEQQPCVRSRFLDEVDPSLLRTEAGQSFEARPDRFQMSGGPAFSYEKTDPYYYRKNLRGEAAAPAKGKPAAPRAPGRSPAPTRQVVYDEGEASVRTGARVMHPHFGEGKVIAVEGAGDMAKATVFFPTAGQKKLVLKFARLQVVG